MSRSVASWLSLPAIALLIGSALAACSSSGGGKPAVCSSAGDLKASVANLKDVQLSEDGINTLRADLTQVRTNLQQVGQDAKAQYSTQVDRVRADLKKLRDAASAARTNPSASTFSAVANSLSTLSTDVKTLSDDVSSAC